MCASYSFPPFQMTHVGSIDFSPTRHALDISFILLNDELAEARPNQFERFWRVWNTEQSFHAPKLRSLTLTLRPSSTDYGRTLRKDGIDMFLHTMPYNLAPNITIIMDNVVMISENRQLLLDSEPVTLYPRKSK